MPTQSKEREGDTVSEGWTDYRMSITTSSRLRYTWFHQERVPPNKLRQLLMTKFCQSLMAMAPFVFNVKHTRALWMSVSTRTSFQKHSTQVMVISQQFINPIFIRTGKTVGAWLSDHDHWLWIREQARIQPLNANAHTPTKVSSE